MLYRSNTLRVLCPEMTIATFSEMPLRIKFLFLTPVRRRSWNSKPLYSLSPPHDWHFATATTTPHSLHTNLPTPAATQAFHQATLKCQSVGRDLARQRQTSHLRLHALGQQSRIVKEATKHSILRWIRIVFSIPILGYIYSPFEEIPRYAARVRFVVVL